MEFFNEASLIAFFSQYAYQPGYVYGFIIVFMLASSFGLPIPEELTLITAGLVAHFAQDPIRFPPPFPGAEGVNTITLCIVSFCAVFFSDLLVYFMGKFFGAKIIKMKIFQKQIAGKGFDRINSWFQKYGGWACGIFRFTPGLRFPGHLSCGFLGIPVWKFFLIDGAAALISVPTQVYFVSKNGRDILEKLQEFKLILFGIILTLFIVWFIRKMYVKKIQNKQA